MQPGSGRNCDRPPHGDRVDSLCPLWFFAFGPSVPFLLRPGIAAAAPWVMWLALGRPRSNVLVSFPQPASTAAIAR